MTDQHQHRLTVVAKQLIAIGDHHLEQVGKELTEMVERLDNKSTPFGKEISAEKTKIMTNSAAGFDKDISMQGVNIEAVQSFNYLGTIVSDQGSKPELLSRIGQTTAAMTRLKTIWADRNISVKSKIRLMRSLVTSIFLYACESWTLTADLERRIQATEMRCFRKILGISYKDHIPNIEVKDRVAQLIGPYEDLLTTVKKRKLRWYGHVTRSAGLAKTILQGTVQGTRRRGRQRKRWEDNIREWTGLKLSEALRKTQDRNGWRKLTAKPMVSPLRSTRLRDR